MNETNYHRLRQSLIQMRNERPNDFDYGNQRMLRNGDVPESESGVCLACVIGRIEPAMREDPRCAIWADMPDSRFIMMSPTTLEVFLGVSSWEAGFLYTTSRTELEPVPSPVTSPFNEVLRTRRLVEPETPRFGEPGINEAIARLDMIAQRHGIEPPTDEVLCFTPALKELV